MKIVGFSATLMLSTVLCGQFPNPQDVVNRVVTEVVKHDPTVMVGREVAKQLATGAGEGAASGVAPVIDREIEKAAEKGAETLKAAETAADKTMERAIAKLDTLIAKLETLMGSTTTNLRVLLVTFFGGIMVTGVVLMLAKRLILG